MIQSMTGFGKAVVELPHKKITVEIKSLNSKQLDLSTRIPQQYREMEMEIRFKKCGISNQPNVCIFDDPCLSKFGALRRGMSALRETICRTFVQHLPVLPKKT